MQIVNLSESIWWSLSDSEREYLERAVDLIVFSLCWGDRATVIALIAEARRRGLDVIPLQIAALWLLAEKVSDNDDY